MRPTEHGPEDYARDLVFLSRTLRRVATDDRAGKSERLKDLAKHLKAAVTLLGDEVSQLRKNTTYKERAEFERLQKKYG